MNEQPSYKPRPEIVSQVAHKDVWCFVGASCMGKTTIMQKLLRLDSAYGEFIVFTSREPRPEDNKTRYTYYEHSDKGLAELLDRIEHKSVLQYNINPFSLLVYGSEASGYPYQHNIGDILASSIDGFRQLGFQNVHVVSIVTNFQDWLHRFNQRFPPGDSRREARRLEASSSLRWSLAQTNAPDHYWLVNDHAPHVVTQELLASLAMPPAPSPLAIALAQDCLRGIEEMVE
jgi:guanylate kinase